MSTRGPTAVARDWARLGAMLNVEPAARAPDLERLLLDTARRAPQNGRLFTLAATWLVRFGDLVDPGRLARLVRDELERPHRPVLGLLLETATTASDPRHARRFAEAVAACDAADPDARPLLDVDRANDGLARLARQEASALARRWGRWFPPFEPKFDAIRPADWVVEQNPALAARGGSRQPSILRGALVQGNG